MSRDDLKSLPPIARAAEMHTRLPRNWTPLLIGVALTVALHIAVISWVWVSGKYTSGPLRDSILYLTVQPSWFKQAEPVKADPAPPR